MGVGPLQVIKAVPGGAKSGCHSHLALTPVNDQALITDGGRGAIKRVIALKRGA